jgi:predicted nucleic acid-binding protein
MLAWAKVLRKRRTRLHLSAVTIAELSTGSTRDTGLRRVVKELAMHDVTPETAYAAGAMRARVRRRKQRDLTLDAVVAATATALPGPVVVLTSDPSGLAALLEGTDVVVASIE